MSTVRESKYSELAWFHSMKKNLSPTSGDRFDDVISLILSKMGWPSSAAEKQYAIQRFSPQINADMYARHMAGSVTVNLPSGQVAISVQIKIPYAGSTDETITVTIGETAVLVTGVDSYQLLVDAAYDAIKSAISYTK